MQPVRYLERNVESKNPGSQEMCSTSVMKERRGLKKRQYAHREQRNSGIPKRTRIQTARYSVRLERNLLIKNNNNNNRKKQKEKKWKNKTKQKIQQESIPADERSNFRKKQGISTNIRTGLELSFLLQKNKVAMQQPFHLVPFFSCLPLCYQSPTHSIFWCSLCILSPPTSFSLYCAPYGRPYQAERPSTINHFCFHFRFLTLIMSLSCLLQRLRSTKEKAKWKE